MPKPGRNDEVIVEGLPSTPKIAPTATKPLQMPADMIRDRSTPADLDARRKSYWIGTLPGGPYQNTDFGGQSFPVFTADVNETADGTERFRRFGNVVRLLKEEVDGILLDIAGKVMQDGKLRCIAAKSYRWTDKDEPAASHVYMVEVPDGFQPPAYNPNTMRHHDRQGNLVADEWKDAPPPLHPKREVAA